MAYTPFSFSKITHYLDMLCDDSSKIETKNRRDIYEDKWLEQIEALIDYQFKPSIAKKIKPLISTEMNIFKRVVDETSLVYKWPAIREAILPEEAADEEGHRITKLDENYSSMIAESNMAAMMKQVNRYTTALNQVVVRPVVRGGVMELDMFTLDSVDILTDPEDWKRIVAIKYYVGMELPTEGSTANVSYMGSGAMKVSTYQKAYLWTIEDYEADNSDGTTKKYAKGMVYELKRMNGTDYPVNEGEEIQYREEGGAPVLPFVLFWRRYPVSGSIIDHCGGSDIVDANYFMAMNLVHFQYLLKFNSYKVGQVSTRNASKLPVEVIIDPGHVFVNEDSEGTGRGLEVIDFTASLREVWETLKERLMTVLTNWGISPANFTLSGAPASGFSLKISNQAKLEARQDAIDIYRERERELFRVMRVVWNTDMPGKPISWKAKLRIDFAEPSYPSSPDEEAKAHEFLKSHNVKTDIDLMMEYNPDMTREEAEEKYRANVATNRAQSVASQAVGLRPAQAPAQQAGAVQ